MSAHWKDFDRLTVPIEPGVTLVEASAGTGKTFAVTRLVLRALLERKVDELSQILVVTFTEPATQELVTRIRGMLHEAAEVWSDVPPEHTVQNDDLFVLHARYGEHGGEIIQRAIASLDDLGVSTIHGFCRRMLMESALESRIHFASTLVKDDSEPLERAAMDWWRREVVPHRDVAALVAGTNGAPEQLVKDLVRPFRRHEGTRIEANPELPASVLLSRFTSEVSRAFGDEMRRRHLMGFDDLLRRLHDVLTRPEEGPDGPLARRIRDRFRVAIIDEFQDTDPTQYPIFTTAFHGCPLFLVGDPKQSIYTFRGADVHAYLRAAQGVDTEKRLTLTENHRSTETMVSAVDGLFRRREQPFWYAEESIGLPPVRAAGRISVPPLLLADGKRALEWMWAGPEHNTWRGLISRDRGVKLLVDAVTTEIARLRNVGVKTGDMAVLVRLNAEAKDFKAALDAAAIPAVVGSDGDVLASDEGEEMVLLVTAIASPRDGYAVRAAMSTRLWGGTAADIMAVSDGAGEKEWTAVTEAFARARDRWIRSGVAVAILSLLAERQAMVRLLSLPGGERRATNVRHLVELLQEASATESISPDAFPAWVARERRVPNTPDRREMRLESDSDAVTILTVHKAKGLQWPVVFCPTLWRTRDENRKSLALNCPYVFSLEGEERVLDLGSAGFDDRSARARQEELAESIRVAYVAMTRAKARCYVAWGNFSGADGSALGWLLRDDADGKHQISLETLVAGHEDIMGISSVEDKKALAAAAHEPATPARWEPRVLALASGQFSTWARTSFSVLTAGSHAHGGDADHDEEDSVSPVRMRAVDVTGFRGFPAGAGPGLALHKMFEDLGEFGDAAAFPEAQVVEILRQHAIVRPEPARWTIADVQQMLVTVCDSAVPMAGYALADVPRSNTVREWKFALSAPDFTVGAVADVLEQFGSPDARAYAPCLRRLTPRASRGYLSGVIDLAFEHQGRWSILDWKSNFLGGADADYSRERMAEEMQDSHYILQYHLYLVALHRHLRARQPGYDPARHWGHVAYVFLRGVTGQGDHGWYVDTPTPHLLDALDRALGGRP